MVGEKSNGQERQVGSPEPAGWRRLALSLDSITWFLVAVGVFLRVAEFQENRALYMDERSLLLNLVGMELFDFQTTLTEEQLAPPGFLVIERLMVRLPLEAKLAGRLVPFLCGIASMFLIRWVARRFVSPAAVPIAVGLFALADWLLYYTNELKQYSGDILLTLLALFLAAGPTAAREAWPSVMSRRWLLALVVVGAVGVWFSYPLALVLAGIGTYLFFEATAGRDWRRVAAVVGMSVLWAASFAVCFRVSHSILSKGRFIWDWWDFAFLPFPPRSVAAFTRELWQLVNVTNSPADVVTPLGVIPSALLAVALCVVGAIALARRWPGGVYLLVAPLGFVLLASCLRQYPFHGRLLLFIVPSIHLMVAEGTAALTRRGGPVLAFAVGAFLLCQPAYEALDHRLVQKRSRTWDSHGDLRGDLLDYLDNREHWQKLSARRRAAR